MAWAARVIARAIERDRGVHFRSCLAGCGGGGVVALFKLRDLAALVAACLSRANDDAAMRS